MFWGSSGEVLGGGSVVDLGLAREQHRGTGLLDLGLPETFYVDDDAVQVLASYSDFFFLVVCRPLSWGLLGHILGLSWDLLGLSWGPLVVS